jgi:predicted P-loop ATPase
MGIYECIQYAKQLKLGLIMFVRTNKNPKYPYNMTVSTSMSNMQVLIENNESNKYLFIYANKRDNVIYNQYNLKVRLIANINAYDDNDIQLIHELNNPKLFKINIKEVEKKLKYILLKNNLPTSIKWLKSKLI